MPRNTRTTPVAPEVTPPAVDFLFLFYLSLGTFYCFFVLFLFLINKYGVQVALRLAPGLVPRLTAEQRPALTVYPQPYLVLHRRSCDNGVGVVVVVGSGVSIRCRCLVAVSTSMSMSVSLSVSVSVSMSVSVSVSSDGLCRVSVSV